MSESARPNMGKTRPDIPTGIQQPCPPGGMTMDEYKTRAKDMIDYISNYLETIRERRVFPDVSPGYMAKLVPDACPDKPEPWEDIMADVERVVMPGITHWQSPYNHSYFPALNCFPSLMGDMLADAINCLGFTWASSPACTELETIVIDWLGKMIGLPPAFLHGNKTHKGLGGGCIQTTASDCTFVTLLAARTDAIRRFKVNSPDIDDSEINGRLIGYCSDQAHSSVEKAGLIGLVKLRFLPSDENLSLRGNTLQEAVYRDREMGLIPFYVCATLGTTGACAFDNLKEIGPVCRSENLWLHIDAAYAGVAFICPEYRHLMAGIEHADSLATNPSKWLMVHFDCSAMWVKDATALHRTFNVEPLYLQHENSGAAIDYMHWQIALSRRFRSLKLWFVLRSFGVEGLQSHIRRGVERSIYFEKMVRADRRFEVAARRYLGMVVFRLVGPNQLTESLLKRLNKQGDIHMVPASLQGKYVIRFTVTSQYTTVEDIDRDWNIIVAMATNILNEARSTTEDSILEKEEEEEEDEEEVEEEEKNKNDIDGVEEEKISDNKKNDADKKEDFETLVPMKEKFEKIKPLASIPNANNTTHNTINGYVSNHHGENTKINDNDDVADNDNDDNNENDENDDDNDERNRKMKKVNSNSNNSSTTTTTSTTATTTATTTRKDTTTESEDNNILTTTPTNTTTTNNTTTTTTADKTTQKSVSFSSEENNTTTTSNITNNTVKPTTTTTGTNTTINQKPDKITTSSTSTSINTTSPTSTAASTSSSLQQQQQQQQASAAGHSNNNTNTTTTTGSGSGSGIISTTDRNIKKPTKPGAVNLKILCQSKSAAAKRRDYGLSLLLSNVPMSPKIVNGSFAALFDGGDVGTGSGSSSCRFDLISLTRKLGMGDGGEEFIRLSPRKRGKLGEYNRQTSLDYGVLKASHKTCPLRMKLMGSLDSKIDDILEFSTTSSSGSLKRKKKKMMKIKNGGEEEEEDEEEEEEEEEEEGEEEGEKERKAGEKSAEVNLKPAGDQGQRGKEEEGGDGDYQGKEEQEEITRVVYDLGNGRVVDKENWDTGHHLRDGGNDVRIKMAATATTAGNDVIVLGAAATSARGGGGGGEGLRKKFEPGQNSVCPLCGRGD